ncbi:S8 family serine peptidase [Lentzea californiensis]|uniref:S8 family serine peptidase n=1 Tax=Lentzea californiensis TaxID=438851 RepID=UPI002166A767|nr:S8 family serine peptidase [Lentzea californiensis]
MSYSSRRVVLALAVAALASAGLATPATAAQGEIRVGTGAKTIAGRYVVVLKENADAADIVTENGGGEVRETWRHALKGFALGAGETTARRIAADPRVAYVEQDAEITADATQPTPSALWGLDRLDQITGRSNGQYVSAGAGARDVRAYVIDSGVRTTHTDFGGRASWGTNTTGDNNNTDCNGHGTHVAGTIGGTTHGVAKSVRLVAVKVLDCSGSGTIAGVISGVNWVTQNAVRPAVANMSLGGGASAALDAAVEASIAAGITYTVAAGNSNRDACQTSPARAPNAITVGATDRNDVRPTNWTSGGSNFGSCVDVFAPGDDITSASNTSDTATRSLSGTSMAAPHAAGVAALYLQRNANASTTTVWFEMALVEATRDVVVNPGPGSPNLLLNSRYTFGGPDGDYNDDQRTDTTVWRPSTGQWFVRNQFTQLWGQQGDVPVPGDYNGDGASDVAVWRPSTGQWFVNGQFTVAWGQQGDVPVQGDYNGDQITDVAVWRPSTGQWFVHNQFTRQWGQQGDVPVPADYDGDGAAQAAVWRPSTGTWHYIGAFGVVVSVQWGQNGDVPVIGDYNGNGGLDLTVWRPSTGEWHVRGVSSTQWGQQGDVPVPGDYNGDGVGDLAVWRPSTGQWFVRNQFTVAWGVQGDEPLAS